MSYSLDAKAAAPTRSNGSIMLSWALMTIPLSVHNGSEETRVSRKEFVKKDSKRPVGRAVTDKNTGEVIPAGDVYRMAQATSGVWVELTDEEMAACTLTRGVAEVVTFVPNDCIMNYLPEDIAQVRPQAVKGKVNPAVETAFSLLMLGMADKRVVALVKFSLRGPARYGLLCPNGDLILIKTSDQIRQPLPLNLVPVDDAHLQAAGALIDAIGTGAPTLINETAEAVQKYVDTKAAGEKAPVREEPNVLGIDLMATINASIAAKKGTS